MADVIKGNFGARPRRRSGWARYEAQEPGGGDEPDIQPPPDQEPTDFGEEWPKAPDGVGTPPFTGEDLEDVGKRPGKKDRETPS